MCANGDILKFAGDAILTLWQCDESQFPVTIDRVVTAAINIQCKMDNYMTGNYIPAAFLLTMLCFAHFTAL